MAKTNRSDTVSPRGRDNDTSKGRSSVSSKGRAAQAAKTQSRPTTQKAAPVTRAAPEQTRPAWATDLVFDVREPKLAVSLRLDADVLRFFRGFGAGYQTRINEVLKAFMQARGGSEMAPRSVVSARARNSSISEGKRAR
jgi:uncharacterized protein (DUF4415 family)